MSHKHKAEGNINDVNFVPYNLETIEFFFYSSCNDQTEASRQNALQMLCIQHAPLLFRVTRRSVSELVQIR